MPVVGDGIQADVDVVIGIQIFRTRPLCHKLHPLGAWYHVAAVYDGHQFRNYVDGVQEGSAEVRLEPQKAGQASLGVRFNKVNYFKGAILAARMTPSALRPEEFMKKP